MKKILRTLCLLLMIGVVSWHSAGTAWAGGDASDGHSHAPEPDAPTTAAATTSGAGETSLQLRLSDLSESAAGTEAPLKDAKIRGFLKRADTGEMMSRVSAHGADAPGVYDVHFNGDNETVALPGAGRYELELNIQPASGEAINTTVPFTLQPAASASETAAVPLWRRAIPFVLGALGLVILLVLIRKLMARRRKTPPGAPGATTSRTPESVSTALLLLALLGAAASTRAWAHEGEVHDEEPAPAAPSAVAPPSNVQEGETTTTTTAGNIRITLIARTTNAKARVLAPGEVQIPASTAQLLDIETAPVQVAQLASGISFSGQIAPDPNSTVRVASIVPGRVVKLNAAQGDRVTRGQVLAIVESRAIGEAQAAYQQAAARFQNARSNFDVVNQQAKAGVFSRAPLEAAQKTRAEAAGDAAQQNAAVQQAQVAFDNATRTARAGSYAAPALEAAKGNRAAARESVQAAQAALSNATASVKAARAQLAQRQQLAKSGAYDSRPVEEAQRVLAAAQAARAAVQSEIATTRANLNRARTLAAEGLVSQRDLEAAKNAFDTATAQLRTAQADEKTAQSERTRQQQLASSGVANNAEVGAAQSALASAQSDVQTREAELQRARTQSQIAETALSREQKVFGGGLANRREIETARANLQAARAGQFKAQRVLAATETALQRERTVFRRDLNNTSQLQTARAGLVSAQSDLGAARSTLDLLKASPGQGVDVPIRAPQNGVVQTRVIALGELVSADAPLFTLVNLDRVALEAALFETDFARVQVGAPVSVTTDALPKRTFRGQISFLGSQVDPQTRTVTARALIPNPGALRPGMFARGQIETGVGKLSILVPAAAVLDDGAAKVVFVPQGEKYLRREVKVGAENGDRVEIKSGLKQGERVVTQGAPALRAQSAKGS